MPSRRNLDRLADRTRICSCQLGNDARYQFPGPYADHIVGSLDYVSTAVGPEVMRPRRVLEPWPAGPGRQHPVSRGEDAELLAGSDVQIEGLLPEHPVVWLASTNRVRETSL